MLCFSFAILFRILLQRFSQRGIFDVAQYTLTRFANATGEAFDLNCARPRRRHTRIARALRTTETVRKARAIGFDGGGGAAAP
jgi:hypothetical protein